MRGASSGLGLDFLGHGLPPVTVGAWLSGLASERQPVELAESDEQDRGAPGRHDQQVLAGEPQSRGVRVVGDEQRVGQMADREDLTHVRQLVRQ